MKTIKDQVAYILRTKPTSSVSDSALIFNYLYQFHSKLFQEHEGNWFINVTKLNSKIRSGQIPPFESLRRRRQELQEVKPPPPGITTSQLAREIDKANAQYAENTSETKPMEAETTKTTHETTQTTFSI